MTPLLFVILPLAIYVPLFLVETYVSFRRLGKSRVQGGGYLHATWEITHTFLILSVNYFIWFYNSALVEVGRVVMAPLFIFALAYALRAALYVYLFYIRSPRAPSSALDLLFAVSHVIILGALVYTLVATVVIMLTGGYQANTYLPQLVWPGLIITLPLIAIPIYTLYRSKLR